MQQQAGVNVIDSDTATKQIAGFAVLAAVAVAIVAVAAVMLLKMRVPSTEFTRGGKGRATQKKRV